MTETIAVPIYACTNPRKHGAIKIHTPQIHHVVPKSWGGTDTAPNTTGTAVKPSNTVVLCGLCHDNVHDLYNKFIHVGGVPGNDVLRLYDPFIVKLAKTAWLNSDPAHRVYTLSASVNHQENHLHGTPNDTAAHAGADPGASDID